MCRDTQAIADGLYGRPTILFAPESGRVRVVAASVVDSLRNGNGCTAMIRGRCHGTQFEAGVERFYVPEEHSARLDAVLRGFGAVKHESSVVISVDGGGRAVVKDLLIDGQHWQRFLAQSPAPKD